MRRAADLPGALRFKVLHRVRERFLSFSCDDFQSLGY